jgi:hypothetical protein
MRDSNPVQQLTLAIAQSGDRPREIEKSANYTRIEGFFIRENPVKSGLS